MKRMGREESLSVCSRASNEGSRRLHEDFTITEKAPARGALVGAFSVIIKFRVIFAKVRPHDDDHDGTVPDCLRLAAIKCGS